MKLKLASALPSSILLGLTLILTIGSSCIRDKYPIKFETASFPDSVINLADVNTEYDDYNSTAPPVINNNFPLVFSTNRRTLGGKYSLIDYTVFISFNQHDGTFDLQAEEYAYPFNSLVGISNSSDHEFGPINAQFSSTESFFVFASDRTNNMELYVSYWTPDTFNGNSPMDPTPFRMTGVNSSSYDAYPSFRGDISEMIFCSNRDGNLDFYTVDLPKPMELLTWVRIADTTYQANPVEILNSPVEDVCPFINGKVIVFTSKREGGFGGYDLWYAEVLEEGFGEPKNFGNKINTAYDEFRPIILYVPKYDEDLLIFSSNRPGGKGGFDLYYTGIDKMTQ